MHSTYRHDPASRLERRLARLTVSLPRPGTGLRPDVVAGEDVVIDVDRE